VALAAVRGLQASVLDRRNQGLARDALRPLGGGDRPFGGHAQRERVQRLEADRFWRKPVSATFHGRDILASVAAHWSDGVDIAEFGPPVDASSLVTLPASEPRRVDQSVVGIVEAVDRFGNLITNIRDTDLTAGARAVISIIIGGVRIPGINHSYSDQPTGNLVALIGSSGYLEIAVNQGSAATKLAAHPGTEVRLELQK